MRVFSLNPMSEGYGDSPRPLWLPPPKKKPTLPLHSNLEYAIITIVMFNFIHRHKRFFFITLVTAGRQAILSRREGVEIAALLPAGERIVQAICRAHQQDPAVVVSNYVIMPDHIHFILIVDFDLVPTFDVIDWIVRFKYETGDAAVWERSFYVQLAFHASQLAAVRRYIQMNPTRAHWKDTHPDRFQRHGPFHLWEKCRAWYAIGNLTILASPFLTGARLTMSKSAAEHAQNITALIDKAKSGTILVSGFISPGEQKVLSRLRASPTAHFIRMVPYGLAANFDPSVEDCRALAQGRELILSGFPPTVPTHPITRANCLEMNDLIKTLCGRATHGEFVRA